MFVLKIFTSRVYKAKAALVSSRINHCPLGRQHIHCPPNADGTLHELLARKNQLSERFPTVTCHVRAPARPPVYYYPTNFGHSLCFNLLVSIAAKFSAMSHWEHATAPIHVVEILIQFAFIKSFGPNQVSQTFLLICASEFSLYPSTCFYFGMATLETGYFR